MGRQTSKGHSVLFEKLPEVVQGWAARGSSGCTPNVKQNPTGREGRCFSWNPDCWSERSQPEGPGNHHHFRRKDRADEPVHYQGLPWHLYPLPKSGLTKEEVQGWSRRCCKTLLESSLSHFPAHSSPWWEDEEAEFDLGPPPELGPNVEWFFQGLAGECKKVVRGHFPTEPPAEEYEKWVEWRGQAVDTPSWWWELEMIPDVDDVQELAWKYRSLLSSPNRWVRYRIIIWPH